MMGVELVLLSTFSDGVLGFGKHVRLERVWNGAYDWMVSHKNIRNHLVFFKQFRLAFHICPLSHVPIIYKEEAHTLACNTAHKTRHHIYFQTKRYTFTPRVKQASESAACTPPTLVSAV